MGNGAIADRLDIVFASCALVVSYGMYKGAPLVNLQGTTRELPCRCRVAGMLWLPLTYWPPPIGYWLFSIGQPTPPGA
jgi:hypothetical protein